MSRRFYIAIRPIRGGADIAFCVGAPRLRALGGLSTKSSLGFNQFTHQGKGAYNCPIAVQGISSFKWEGGNCDRARYVITIWHEANDVVQPRHTWIRRVVEVDCFRDYPALAVRLPRAQLAAVEVFRAVLSRIYYGHRLIGMQRNYLARRKISLQVSQGDEVRSATKPLIAAAQDVRQGHQARGSEKTDYVECNLKT